ncbi:hypothetical protein ABIB40_001494 [Pedobacter sp. UYP30]|uniref:RteC domain-containing protein n=1 Tax=Pedobacter sp. UYP30 TaxID=1756400 RepID=UPI00339339A6
MKQLNFESLYQKMVQDLSGIHREDITPIKKLSSLLTRIKTDLLKLKNHLIENPALTSEEEIIFFKETKPKFFQWQIYYLELYNIENARPILGVREVKKHYENQLKFYTLFLHQNEFNYQYYKLRASELDSQYFIRGSVVTDVLTPEIPEVDPSFSTGIGYLFSKFMAYEKLQKYILDQLSLISEDSSKPPLQKDSIQRLTWTGDKTNLVEVIYGLFYTGQLNHGNATVADIIKWMEEQLDVDLKRAYRNFLDIRNRKRDSHTRYLDKMRASIEQRVDEDNRYEPNRGIKLRDNQEK